MDKETYRLGKLAAETAIKDMFRMGEITPEMLREFNAVVLYSIRYTSRKNYKHDFIRLSSSAKES